MLMLAASGSARFDVGTTVIMVEMLEQLRVSVLSKSAETVSVNVGVCIDQIFVSISAVLLPCRTGTW
jgi:hypothetical protein